MGCVVISALFVTITFLTMVQGVLTLYIYTKEKRLRKREPSPFVYSLAVSITCLSAFSFAFNARLLSLGCRNDYSILWCVILNILLKYLHVVSCFCVTCLALYRYLYLCWPLRYPTLVTKRRCCYVTLACWALPMSLVAVPSVIDGKAPCADMNVTVSFHMTYVVMYILGALATFVAYLLVALEFRKKRHSAAPNSDMAKFDLLVKVRTERCALHVFALYTILSLPHIITVTMNIMHGTTTGLNRDIAALLQRLHLLLFLPFYAWANPLFRAVLVSWAKNTWARLTCGTSADTFELHSNGTNDESAEMKERRRLEPSV
ncbi:olfactory receptor 49-like isoform X2 [Penaeus japonicus]|uniref:olfactory receptor 49-like isoform X2 n=1 Tax=Penaeus japonicus TaxID=27405 RepID=UPI001C7149D6|nr:olfactory receptor 49-like isoform X2 [Penaeus japonicus]